MVPNRRRYSYPILEFEAKDHETRVVPTWSAETVKVLRRMKQASKGDRYLYPDLRAADTPRREA